MVALRGAKTILLTSVCSVLMMSVTASRIAGAAQESLPMTRAQTETTMQAYAAALLGGGAYDDFFDEDVVITMTGVPGVIRGPVAAKAAIDALHHEQFDAQPEVVSSVIGEGSAALELVFHGTHTGEFGGISSTGKTVNVPYSVFYELADSKITALRAYGLVEGLSAQLVENER
jgi:ketosteroid isomerase-like protein